MSGFNTSDKVVCVNDSGEGRNISASMLRFPGGSVVRGAVYCVERVYDGDNGSQGLILTSPKIYFRVGGWELGFNSTRFRKVRRREIVVEDEIEAALPAGEVVSERD